MTLWVLIGIPAVLLGVAIVVGARLPKTHQAASRIRLSLPPEKIHHRHGCVSKLEARAAWHREGFGYRGKTELVRGLRKEDQGSFSDRGDVATASIGRLSRRRPAFPQGIMDL